MTPLVIYAILYSFRNLLKTINFDKKKDSYIFGRKPFQEDYYVYMFFGFCFVYHVVLIL